MAKAGNYYYEQLNKEQQKAYYAMKEGLLKLQDSFMVPMLPQKELSDIYFLIRMDCPAIFYSVTFSYRHYADSTAVEMIPQYLFTKDKIKEHRQAMESRVKKLARQAANLDEKGKELFIHDFIVENLPEYYLLWDWGYIIESVLKPYSDIKSKISPRFKDKIPYIVQYNQSDYAFISMLAVRFGEWMYNTGESLIFGEIEDSGSSANLEYPGGSLMSYNLHQSMTSFSFNHLLPDYYQYGKEKAILKAEKEARKLEKKEEKRRKKLIRELKRNGEYDPDTFDQYYD